MAVKFATSRESGFHMTFENGWTVSVQWGEGTYSNHNKDNGRMTGRSAEVAAWDKNGTWYDFGTDKVNGWLPPDKVLEFMNTIAAMK